MGSLLDGFYSALCALAILSHKTLRACEVIKINNLIGHLTIGSPEIKCLEEIKLHIFLHPYLDNFPLEI